MAGGIEVADVFRRHGPAFRADAQRAPRPRPAPGDGRDRSLPHRRARRACPTLRRLRPRRDRLQLLPQPSLSQVPGPGAGGLGRRAAGGVAARSLLPRRLHAAGAGRRHRVPEQGGGLRHPVPRRRRDAARHRGRPAPPRRRDRRRRRAAQLGPGDAAPSACPLHRAGRRPLARPDALGRLPARVLPVGQGARPAVPAALPRTSRRSLRRAAGCASSAISRRSPSPAPSPPTARRCAGSTGWSTPSRPSAAPSRCWPISAATPIASPSPTAGSSPWPTTP